MDKLTPQQRHRNMAAIRSKDTKPEMIVRRGLWKRGFRYRLNDRRLPGHPDLVLRKYRTCVFVNGCFWHGHEIQFTMHNSQFIMESSACCKIPRTNREFWVAKIRRNKERDREELRKLAAMGWHCITVWECELTSKRREETLESIAFTLNHIWLQDHCLQPHSQAFSKGRGEPGEMVYPLFEEEDDGGVLMAAEEVSYE
ncbi:MAG: DNA mismatch endonuclease Vsr [Bacteroidaceae bacterium]|nr:DNA mismatch endonuclease Vsr [Bacteroidaceae bacterium]